MKRLIYILLLSPLIMTAQVDWSSEMPPAMNQGSSSECVSYACSYLMARNICKSEGIAPENFSPAFIHNQVTATTGNNGMVYGEALDFLMQNGICRLTELPVGMPGIVLRYQSLKYRIDGWKEYHDIDTAKEELANGPILTLIQNPSGSLHAVCVVGYNDEGFKYLNSEGPGWGINGYGIIPYNQSSQCFWSVIDDLVYEMPQNAYLVHWNLPGEQMAVCATYLIEDLYGNADTIYPVLNSYWLLTNQPARIQLRNYFKAISTVPITMNWIVYDVAKWNNGGLSWITYDTVTTRSVKDTLFFPWWWYQIYAYDLTLDIYDVMTGSGNKMIPDHGIREIDLLGRNCSSGYYIRNRKLYYHVK